MIAVAHPTGLTLIDDSRGYFANRIALLTLTGSRCQDRRQSAHIRSGMKMESRVCFWFFFLNCLQSGEHMCGLLPLKKKGGCISSAPRVNDI